MRLEAEFMILMKNGMMLNQGFDGGHMFISADHKKAIYMTGNYGMDWTLRRFTIILALSFATVDCPRKMPRQMAVLYLGYYKVYRTARGVVLLWGYTGRAMRTGTGAPRVKANGTLPMHLECLEIG